MTDYSKYDKTIKIGDIVTSPFDGYWEVNHIQIREPYANGTKNFTPAPLMTGKYLMKGDGTPIKHGRTESWDAWYSHKLTEDWIRTSCNKEIDDIEIKRQNLFHLIGNNYDY
jgi:hypothetical protein